MYRVFIILYDIESADTILSAERNVKYSLFPAYKFAYQRCIGIHARDIADHKLVLTRPYFIR